MKKFPKELIPPNSKYFRVINERVCFGDPGWIRDGLWDDLSILSRGEIYKYICIARCEWMDEARKYSHSMIGKELPNDWNNCVCKAKACKEWFNNYENL